MARTKLGLLAAAGAVLAASFPALAEETDVATQLVDVMNKIFGVYPGFRAQHAKGVVVEGSFTATPAAAALSTAALFTGAKIPVTARFSDNTGIPQVPDGIADANPHGMAIKYHLPDGSDTDMVTNSLHFFPVATGEDFLALLTAISQSPKDAPHPTPLEQFVATHPSVPAAFGSAHTPDSFAHEKYFGINAFVFVNKAGVRLAVRYQIVPEKTVYLDPRDAAMKAPDFLVDDLANRLKSGPVVFHLKAQLAGKDDQTSDGSKPWPDDRKVVDLGVLNLEKAVPDSADAQKTLLFLPTTLTDGIEASDDPVIDTRGAAYAVSFSRRNP
jgi:catalase